MRDAQPAWWRGTRGEWYVAAQAVLIAVVFFGPRSTSGLPPWPNSLAMISVVVGAALGTAGLCLFAAGALTLGANLTPLPYPKPGGRFIQTGAYRFVRHPIYAGGVALAFGWALMVRGWLTLAYVTALLIFLEIKSAREERWLVERFPEYRDYQRRVGKLVPFIR